MLHFGIFLHNYVLSICHHVEQQPTFLLQVSIAVKDAKENKLVEVVHVLSVLLEELHVEALVKDGSVNFRDVKNLFHFIDWDKPARDVLGSVFV